jgi:hypothetical protein
VCFSIIIVNIRSKCQDCSSRRSLILISRCLENSVIERLLFSLRFEIITNDLLIHPFDLSEQSIFLNSYVTKLRLLIEIFDDILINVSISLPNITKDVTERTFQYYHLDRGDVVILPNLFTLD